MSNKIVKMRLILNKINKGASLQIPKKKLDCDIRGKIDKAKWAFVKFEGFE